VGRFLINWYLANRNARAWVTAVFLLAFLLWAVWQTHAKRIEYKEISAQLVEVVGDQPTNTSGIYVGKVRLQDGKTVRLMLPPRRPLPQPGDSVPIIYELYDNGDVYYAFDNNRWIMQGGIAR
jgi:hypothetical protein